FAAERVLHHPPDPGDEADVEEPHASRRAESMERAPHGGSGGGEPEAPQRPIAPPREERERRRIVEDGELRIAEGALVPHREAARGEGAGRGYGDAREP